MILINKKQMAKIYTINIINLAILKRLYRSVNQQFFKQKKIKRVKLA